MEKNENLITEKEISDDNNIIIINSCDCGCDDECVYHKCDCLNDDKK